MSPASCFALGRRPRAVLAFLLLLLPSCQAELRDPTRFLQPGTRGQTGTGGSTAALSGTWQAFILIAVETDLQSWVTTWRLDADGQCHFRREVSSLSEGGLRVRDRACRWTSSGSTLSVTFGDNGEVYPMAWSFKATGSTVLILEGVEYRRVAG